MISISFSISLSWACKVSLMTPWRYEMNLEIIFFFNAPSLSTTLTPFPANAIAHLEQ